MEKLYKVPPVAQSCASRRSRHAAAEMSIERRNTSSIVYAQRFCAAMPPADEDMCCPAEEFYHIFAESLRGAGVA